MSLNSINLSPTPLSSPCDTTRLQMATKQFQQCLTHENCEIPFVIGDDYRDVTDSSHLGVLIAPEDGHIFLKGPDFIVIYYKNDELQEYYIPKIHKTTGDFCCSLTHCLDTNDVFYKGDIIFSYDCFKEGVPTYGYNVNVAFTPFFGLNHEDGLVVSSALKERMRARFSDTVIIPINNYTMIAPYQTSPIKFIPPIGHKLDSDNVLSLIEPKINSNMSNKMVKANAMHLISQMTVSDFVNLNNLDNKKFNTLPIKTKIYGGTIADIKIHKLFSNNEKLIDKRVNNELENLYEDYLGCISDYLGDVGNYVKAATNKKRTELENYYKQLIFKYSYYNPNIKTPTNKKNLIDLKNCLYILEIKIVKESKTTWGDKLANRYANKGVISSIIPDNLKPVSLQSNTPIDLIYSPFAVFSRMNVSQILEGIIAKNVKYCNDLINQDPTNVVKYLTWLNEAIIKPINNNEYYENIKEHIERIKLDKIYRNKFLKSVHENNLFIECPNYTEIDTKTLLKNSVKINESIHIKKELIEHLKNELNLPINFNIQDVVLDNIFVAPMYISKLNKVTDHIHNSRDIGQLKHLTKQPTRGRAQGGGSTVGQMEMEALEASGLFGVVKEFVCVKSDGGSAKNNLLDQMISTGEFDINKLPKYESKTKEVADQFIKFYNM